MSIVYPLSLPAGLGPSHMKLAAVTAVGETISPFAGSAQEQLWQDQHWELELAWPPMTRAQAAPLIAFLEALQGKYGTFLFGDPLAITPLGTALGSPVVSPPPGGYGPRVCTSAVDGGGAGGVVYGWTNPGNATSASYASCAMGTFGRSTNLICSAFGFAVPAVAPTIVGVQLICSAYASVAGPTLFAQLSSPSHGSLQRSIALPTSPTTITLGSPLDLWGSLPWGPTDVNSAAFEVVLTAATVPIGGATVFVGNVQLQLFLSVPNQSGSNQLWTAGWTPNQAGALLAGDYIELPGTPPRLHQATTNTPTDGGGNATIDIFPSIREVPTPGMGVLTALPVGTFRLAQNRREWDADKTKTFTIALKAREAI